jgi:hypothetical protein
MSTDAELVGLENSDSGKFCSDKFGEENFQKDKNSYFA